MATRDYTPTPDIKLLIELALLQSRRLKRNLHQPIMAQIKRLVVNAKSLQAAKYELQNTKGGSLWERFKRHRAIGELSVKIAHCEEQLASWLSNCLRAFQFKAA